MQRHKITARRRNKKNPLIVKISSSLSTAIFDCGIYSKWRINVNLSSTVKLNLVKFHSGTSTQISINMLGHTVVG